MTHNNVWALQNGFDEKFTQHCSSIEPAHEIRCECAPSHTSNNYSDAGNFWYYSFSLFVYRSDSLFFSISVYLNI